MATDGESRGRKLLATADELKALETLLGHAPRRFDAFVGETVAPRSR